MDVSEAPRIKPDLEGVYRTRFYGGICGACPTGRGGSELRGAAEVCIYPRMDTGRDRALAAPPAGDERWAVVLSATGRARLRSDHHGIELERLRRGRRIDGVRRHHRLPVGPARRSPGRCDRPVRPAAGNEMRKGRWTSARCPTTRTTGCTTATPRSDRIYIVRRGGRIYALRSMCTHRACPGGCRMRARHCAAPAHPSRFAAHGTVTKGPATRPLPTDAIVLTQTGRLVVDKSKAALGRAQATRRRTSPSRKVLLPQPRPTNLGRDGPILPHTVVREKRAEFATARETGGGEGDSKTRCSGDPHSITRCSQRRRTGSAESPHPSPLPEYRERELAAHVRLPRQPSRECARFSGRAA